MKKSLLLLLLSFVLILAACNQQSGSEESSKNEEKSESASSESTEESKDEAAGDSGEKAEVTFWHAMNDDHEKWLKDKTDEFNKDNENIEVKLVNQGSYDDLSKKLLAAGKAKKLPTISQAYGEWILNYKDNDLVEDLKPMIDGENGFENYEDINKVFREDNTFGEEVLGLPFNKSTRVLFVNNDLLKEAGVEAPKTWEELKTAAEKMTTEKDGKKVVGMGFENGLAHEISMWIKQAGGEFIDEEKQQVKFNSEEGLKALEYIDGMLNDGTARMAGEDEYLSGPFTNGDVGMYIGSSAGIAYVQKDAKDIDWTTVPLPKGEEEAAPFQGTNITMFKTAEDAAKQGAFEYMKFLVSEENTTDWAKTTGYLPVRTTALESDEWKKFVEENPAHKAGVSQYDNGFIEERVPGAFAMKEAIAKELDKMLFEDAKPKETLENMEKEAQKAIDEAK
ncbi:ABC transporter substrate-binding protein [Abyssicoccus albus]|uniref:ABC transporter substrate-binding protein n=1 Tax=Abyssicoccus albus TaxID=1817405 RepID=UPI00097E3775|nr:ABC transporter substrate-binding protein [Abyssicoccus albus]AQL55747.1 hypothetical protein BVH56_01710 [Abyssicoccus albus]